MDALYAVLSHHQKNNKPGLITAGGNPACLCGWVGLDFVRHLTEKVIEALGLKRQHAVRLVAKNIWEGPQILQVATSKRADELAMSWYGEAEPMASYQSEWTEV